MGKASSAGTRRRVLHDYLREIKERDWLADPLVLTGEPGAWNVPDLNTCRDGVQLIVQAMRPFDGSEDIQLVVHASNESLMHRVIADGFVLRQGVYPGTMTDDHWKQWNL